MVAARVESGRPNPSLDHRGFNALLRPRLCLATPGIDRSGSIAGNGNRTRIFISILRQRSDTRVNKTLGDMLIRCRMLRHIYGRRLMASIHKDPCGKSPFRIRKPGWSPEQGESYPPDQ